MTVRKAATEDAPALCALLEALGYSPPNAQVMARKIPGYQADSYQLFVAEEKDIVVGFISMHWYDIFHSAGLIGRITALCVSEDYRDAGIGSKLMNEAERFLSDRGCSDVEVTTHMRRTRTHDFYLRHGYTEDSKRYRKKLNRTAG
jgi:ribosomal protein S18 acetylase RimI-like enzyme